MCTQQTLPPKQLSSFSLAFCPHLPSQLRISLGVGIFSMTCLPRVEVAFSASGSLLPSWLALASSFSSLCCWLPLLSLQFLTTSSCRVHFLTATQATYTTGCSVPHIWMTLTSPEGPHAAAISPTPGSLHHASFSKASFVWPARMQDHPQIARHAKVSSYPLQSVPINLRSLHLLYAFPVKRKSSQQQ